MSKETSDDKSPADDTAGKSDGNVDDAASPGRPSSGQKEIGGRKGPDPTRYGDWEKNGRCIDF